jgi:hypothetical protein
MKNTISLTSNYLFRYLLLVCALVGFQGAHAQYGRLVLSYPGEDLYVPELPKNVKLSTWLADQQWSSLSLKDGALTVGPVTESIESDWVSVSGKNADRLLEGKTLKHPPKSTGISLKSPDGTLVFARFDIENGNGSKGLTPGNYPSYVEPALLREGWTLPIETGGRKWKFSTRHQKRPDGKLLAGSLELLLESGEPEHPKVILPRASGMAFEKQEVLWLGDLNGDSVPDLIIKRTWLSGEFDIFLLVSNALTFNFASITFDPDRPTSYFSSGVEPESNGFRWNKKWPTPTAFKFSEKGRFSIGEENWHKMLFPNAPPLYQEIVQSKLETSPPSEDLLSLPITLTDRLFKLDGETIRFTLEHLPRAAAQDESSSSGSTWGGTVLVRTTFRGKTQVLMEASRPDSGIFSLSVGTINGEPSIRIDHQPHYNNSFRQYWIYDQATSRFRRLQIEQSQGC